MFEEFLRLHHAFQESGAEDPLLETLRLVDLISNGTFRQEMNSLSLAQQGIDLAQVVAKRKEGIPLEYVIGRAVFMGVKLFCSPETLIPREETELLAKVALEFAETMGQKCEGYLTIVDMGTGCGNIAISLALNSVDTQILASDISPAAVDIARQNVDRFKLQKRIQVFHGDLFDSFRDFGYEESVHIVVCNPPYIPTSSLSKLAPEIVEYEPIVALNAGAYGIDIFRRLIAGATSFLRPGGVLLFEIGAGQDRLVTRLFSRNEGYEKIDFVQDENGVNRVACAVRSDRHAR